MLGHFKHFCWGGDFFIKKVLILQKQMLSGISQDDDITNNSIAQQCDKLNHPPHPHAKVFKIFFVQKKCPHIHYFVCIRMIDLRNIKLDTVGGNS